MSPFLMMCFDVRGGGLLFNYLLPTNISLVTPPSKNSGASV